MSWRTIVILGIGLALSSQELRGQTTSKSEPLTAAAIPEQDQTGSTRQSRPARRREGERSPVSAKGHRSVGDLAGTDREPPTNSNDDCRQSPKPNAQPRSDWRGCPPQPDSSIIDVQDLEELERIVDAREKQLDDSDNGLRKQIQELDTEVEQFRTRPEELTNELAEIEDRLREIDDESEGLPASGEAKEQIPAHRIFLQARRQRAENERKALQAEAAWYESTAAADLLQTQQELAAKTLSLKVAELDLLQNELGKRRGNEADQRVRESEIAVAKASDELKPLATENLELTKEQRDVRGKAARRRTSP